MVYHFEIYRDEYEDIFDWIHDTIPKDHLVKMISHEISIHAVQRLFLERYRIRISIDDENSAMLFKLRWMNL
jgi:hypothetical protein